MSERQGPIEDELAGVRLTRGAKFKAFAIGFVGACAGAAAIWLGIAAREDHARTTAMWNYLNAQEQARAAQAQANAPQARASEPAPTPTPAPAVRK